MGGLHEACLRCGRRSPARREPGQGSGGRSVDPSPAPTFRRVRPTRLPTSCSGSKGYYTEDDDPTTIDCAEFKSTLEKLIVYCSNNPSVGVVTADDEVIGNNDGN